MSTSEPIETFPVIVQGTSPLSATFSESDRLAHLIFENSSDAIVITDDDGNFVAVNPAACALFGYSQDQMFQMRVGDLVTPTLPNAAEQYARYLETGQENGEFAFVRPDGDIHIAAYSACRLAPGKHASILRDITERNLVEARLRESEQKFSLLFEKAATATSFARFPEGIILDVNGEFERLFGYSRQEVIGKTTLQLGIHPSVQIRSAIVAELEQQGYVRDKEVTLFTKSGEQRTVLTSIAVVELGGKKYLLSTVQDVTERKAAEAALKERVAEIETLLETIPAAVWIATDPECKRIIGNRASYELLRMPPQSNVSKSAPPEEFPTAYRAFINGREIEPHEHPMQRAAAEGREILGAEETLVFEDGTRREIYGNASPLFDAEGKVRGVIAAFVDITERKRIEEQLRANQEWLNLAFDTSRMIIWSWDFVANQIEATPNLSDIYGCPPIQMVEHGMALVHPDDRARHEATVKKGIETGHYYSTLRVIRPDNGEIVWIEEQATVFPDESGMPRKLLGITLDVTERQKREQARQQSESQFRRLFEANVLGILITDLSGTIRQANDAFLHLIGYSREELGTGQLNWVNLTPPEMHALDEEGVRQLRERGSFLPYEKAYVRKDGSLIPVLVGAATLESDPDSAIAYVLDLSEQKGHEREIEELNTRLRRAMRETHHRVKNNLQVISAMIEMQVLEHSNEGAVPLEAFQRLKAHVHTLAIVHDLLTLGIQEKEDSQRLSTRTVLERLLPMLQQTAWKRRVGYAIDEVYLTSKQCIALALILNELVSNSLKHGKSEADVFFTVEEEAATLAVYDDGEGFPDGFDPKEAANTGLELVANLVKTDLGGMITYGNHQEGGGQVIVTFPLPKSEE